MKLKLTLFVSLFAIWSFLLFWMNSGSDVQIALEQMNHQGNTVTYLFFTTVKNTLNFLGPVLLCLSGVLLFGKDVYSLVTKLQQKIKENL